MSRTGDNIFKRKDGRWEGRFIKCHQDGKAKYGYVYAKTYKETKLKLQEAIQNNTAISIPFGWLGTVGNYINVLHECSGISDGEYYLAWKAITDNTSPMIRSVKVVDVTI